MKSQHGFKSEIFTKKHGKLTLQKEEAATFTTQSRIADELKATGKYKRVCCWSHSYGGRATEQFFVLAFA